MKKQKNIFLRISGSVAIIALISAIAFSGASLFAKDDHPQKPKDMNNTEMKKDETKKGKKYENIERKGKINLKKIDKNKDGKVFQDPMHWNVISDKPGKCPLCKMELKEVTLQEAKGNLVQNGFKVK